jgi:hypothetical protein
LFPGKNPVNHGPRLFKPLFPLAGRAGDNDTETTAMKITNAAQAENAVPPDGLKGVSKGLNFPFREGV